MLSIHLWNVASALQMTKWHVFICKSNKWACESLFSLSLLEQLQSDYNLKNHQENNNVSDHLTFQAFDQ